MEKPFPRADVWFDFVFRVAEHLCPPRRVHHGAGFEIPVPDAFLRTCERQLQPLFVLAERGLGALLIGEIEMRADDAHDRSARLATHWETSREHVDVVAVLVPQPELGLVGRSLAAGDAVVRLVGARPIVRVDQALPGADVRLDLVARVAEHLLPSTGVHDRVGFEVPVPDPFPRAGDGEGQPFFVVAQVAIRLLLRGDLAHDDLHGAIAVERQWRGCHADVEQRAIRPDDPCFERRHVTCLCAPQTFADAVATVVVEAIDDRSSNHLTAVIGRKHGHGSRVREPNAILIGDQDAVR